MRVASVEEHRSLGEVPPRLRTLHRSLLALEKGGISTRQTVEELLLEPQQADQVSQVHRPQDRFPVLVEDLLGEDLDMAGQTELNGDLRASQARDLLDVARVTFHQSDLQGALASGELAPRHADSAPEGLFGLLEVAHVTEDVVKDGEDDLRLLTEVGSDRGKVKPGHFPVLHEFLAREAVESRPRCRGTNLVAELSTRGPGLYHASHRRGFGLGCHCLAAQPIEDRVDPLDDRVRIRAVLPIHELHDRHQIEEPILALKVARANLIEHFLVPGHVAQAELARDQRGRALTVLALVAKRSGVLIKLSAGNADADDALVLRPLGVLAGEVPATSATEHDRSC